MAKVTHHIQASSHFLNNCLSDFDTKLYQFNCVDRVPSVHIIGMRHYFECQITKVERKLGLCTGLVIPQTCGKRVAQII